MNKKHVLVICLVFLMLASACSDQENTITDPLFTSMEANETGIGFQNILVESEKDNLLNYLYFYNGGGVAVGDINNDGLIDIYFGSNQGANQLYLNKGAFKFEDISSNAGVEGVGDWTNGVNMVDVNGDGWLDIYVCYVSGHNGFTGRNLLFINNQDNTFTEAASEYGLDISSYSAHTTFFDYDNDGDLDMYLLNQSVHNKGTFGNAEARGSVDPDAGDRLFKNEGNRFIDVTAEAGIATSKLGYGLDVSVSDLNRDGYTDILVSNDFHEHDYLYINNQDGTFTDQIETLTGHTSRFSMGNDIADINNDGYPDFAVLDMLPVDEKILKTSEGAESWDIYDLKVRFGYHHQVSRNTLQVNNGGKSFSEVAFLAGVYATDWSWSSLFFDMDQDGHKDLFITNGIFRRPNDSDYISYISSQAVQQKLTEGDQANNLEISSKMPNVRIPNYAYRNMPNTLGFIDSTSAWGLGKPGYSHGAAYADFDNDGDLDLVINNVNEDASIYRNNTERKNPDYKFLKIQFNGEGSNTFGLGANGVIYTPNGSFSFENYNSRGFYSSISPEISIGLGVVETIDSVVIKWPGNKESRYYELVPNQTLTATPGELVNPNQFEEIKLVSDPSGAIPFTHIENNYVDFDVQPLMPHKLSTQGPAIAKGDINGDGTQDLFFGGAAGQPSEIYYNRNGGFERVQLPGIINEVVDAVLFDADGDNDLDLYVAYGGNEINRQQDFYLDDLFHNEDGKFRPTYGSLPEIAINSSCVATGDYDGDGDLDLFVGNRSIPGKYGLDGYSMVLQNDGKGVFRVGARPSDFPGMITDAQFADIDGDGQDEIIYAGEWMGVHVSDFSGSSWIDKTEEYGLSDTDGWWNVIKCADIDGDNDLDLVVGNWGENQIIKASKQYPARLYVSDFDDNGTTEPFISYYKQGDYYPILSRNELIKQIPELKKKYVNYADFSAAKLDQIFTQNQLDSAVKKVVYTFKTSIFRNSGAGFKQEPLPEQAQVAPVFDIEILDTNGDGFTDIFLGGNFYGSRPYFGRYDASYGILFEGSNSGEFAFKDSEIQIKGEVRDMETIEVNNKQILIIAKNNDKVQLIELLK